SGSSGRTHVGRRRNRRNSDGGNPRRPAGEDMTDSAVLVLNRHFQPIHVTNAKRAFSLLYLGVARVIDREFKTFDFDSWAPRSELNLDHVVPRAQGGRTTWENVVCCCIDCNLTKAARTPEQAKMKLLKVPVRPRWTPTFRTNGGKVRYREWLPFLGLPDASYWNVELTDE